MTIRLLVLIAIIAIISCQDKAYSPDGLRKLTPEEIIQRVKQGVKPSPDIIVRNQEGQVLLMDSILKMSDLEQWTTDVYVDSEGNDVELVFRMATDEDIALIKRVQEIIEKEITLPKIPVDCSRLTPLLDSIERLDRATRNGGADYNPNIDRANLTTVVNIIEQCKSTVLDSLNRSSIHTIWLVVQHGPSKFQKQYLPLFKQLQGERKLRSTSVAMMEDRILMSDNKPQLYGTQVVKSQETGKWVLHEIEDPEYVNQRRAEVGFGPIEEYLGRWEIEFGVEQKTR